MPEPNINNSERKKRVLVAPLDWGLGHATRCIPIISYLLDSGVEVILAAEGPCAALLAAEFPGLLILHLRGYRIGYPEKGKSMFIKLLAQFPGIIKKISREHRWLRNAVNIHKIDAVISDNRFGLYASGIPCVYITHQLFIETGMNWLNSLAQKFNYSYINKFTNCWVPDEEGENNLAGKLSHPVRIPETKVEYVGALSRFKKETSECKGHILILLSGPEPQRTIFEDLLLAQINEGSFTERIILVRGLPGKIRRPETIHNKLEIHDHLPAYSLSKLMQEASCIIARSGYSTIMDLVKLKQKAILVATPGQPEQEYLARYLKKRNLFYACPQESFDLRNAIAAFKEFIPGIYPENTRSGITIFNQWLKNIR